MPHITISNESNYGRSGQLRVNNRQMETPSMYYQNSYPGGGGHITRFITYTDLRNNHIPTLHNYYYMIGYGAFKFSSGFGILNNESINEFTIRSREIFCGQREIQTRDEARLVDPPRISQAHPYGNLTIRNWNPFALLDSGFGNFLMSSVGNILDTNPNPRPPDVLAMFQQEIPGYFEFCQNHSFDIMMALDYSEKNTDKQWADNVVVKRIRDEMVNNVDQQILLLRESIRQSKSDNYNFAVFAPIHGKTSGEIIDFTNRILEMEKEEGERFDGFGISPPKRPDYRVITVKALRDTLEQHNDKRPIHALGAGAIRDVIPLVHAGADMFDNVTPWRRVIDGNGSSAVNVNDPNANGRFSSFLIPLVDRNGDIITANQENVLAYVPLNQINTNFSCDCDICRRFGMAQIKELYSHGSGSEDFNFAVVLCYNHAINQYDSICNRLRKDIANGEDIMTLINEITDPTYRKRTTDLVAKIQNFNQIL